MRFEVGKFYKHSGSGFVHIVGRANTTMWGDCLVAETAGHGNSELMPVGDDEVAAQNWSEATREEWESHFS